MTRQKLPQILQLGIILLGIAIGSFGMTVMISKVGFSNLLTHRNIETQSAKTELVGTASAQTAIPGVTNQITEVPKEFEGTTIYEAKLKPNEKVIALTFDDGPGPKNTAQVLEILKKNNIKATFFMIGQMVQFHPQAAKQVADDGHVIGNHTWHHWYRRLDTATAASEINRTADIIYKTTGVKTTLFRPPGGFLHNGLADYAKSQKYVIMMWSEASGDAERHPPQAPTMIKNVLKSAKPGAIVLMHDGGGNRSQTVKALPEVIAGLKAQGYQFATIPELLQMQAKEQNQVKVASPAGTKVEHPK